MRQVLARADAADALYNAGKEVLASEASTLTASASIPRSEIPSGANMRSREGVGGSTSERDHPSTARGGVDGPQRLRRRLEEIAWRGRHMAHDAGRGVARAKVARDWPQINGGRRHSYCANERDRGGADAGGARTVGGARTNGGAARRSNA
jgi:hypothetical protein